MAGQRELVEQLFEAALALEPTEREAFFDQVCGDDPELRRMVEDLLAEDARAGSFLRHPPFDLLGKTAGSFHPVAEDTHPANRKGRHGRSLRGRRPLSAKCPCRPEDNSFPYRR